MADLDISEDDKQHSRAYQPTRVRDMRKLLSSVDLPTDGVFVDLGCGKGKILLLAASHGFRRVVGVEISPRLCEIANENIRRYRAKVGADLDIEVLLANVLDYAVGPEDSVFYFFRPFDLSIMESVLSKIVASVRSHQREAWLIFSNFEYDELFDAHPVFRRHSTVQYGGARFVVFSNQVS